MGKFISKLVKARARRKRPVSGLEKQVYALLDSIKIKYKKEYKISRLHVDILIEPNLVIECQGCYFHKHECLKPKGGWKASDLVVQDKDSKRFAFLTSQGYIVKEIWECEMKEPEKVIRKVKSWVKGT